MILMICLIASVAFGLTAAYLVYEGEKRPTTIKDLKMVGTVYENIDNIMPDIYLWLYKKYENEFDWVAKLDIDEYLVIKETENNIKTFAAMRGLQCGKKYAELIYIQKLIN